MRYDAGFRGEMGRTTLKIVLSLGVAGVAGLCVLLLLEALLPGASALNAGVRLFSFQLSSMIAVAVFAGLAIVIYARASLRRPGKK